MKLVVLDANAFWTEQLFRQCGRFADVLLLKPRDFRAHRAQAGTVRSDRAPRLVADHVWEQRLSLPPGWMVELWPWSQRRITGAIRAFTGQAPFTLVLTYPQYRRLIPALQPDLSVYYNLDDYRDNWPRYGARVPAWEAETVERADLTICIAAHRVNVLREQHPAKRDRIHQLPLGVTPEFMAAAGVSPLRLERGESGATLSAHRGGRGAGGEVGEVSIPASVLPPTTPGVPHSPVAGYIGALNYRFDFAFLADVAAQLPDVSFVLGGRVQEDGDAAWRTGLECARRQPNVKFLGWVEHAQLGEHLARFDVLLMPYSHCHFNTNACPAKLWDYLGTGKPIVANDANPETLLWTEVVRVGATPEVFTARVRDALAERGGALYERRLAIAREHTWTKLGTRLEQILNPAWS